jgi:BA14K-like protein
MTNRLATIAATALLAVSIGPLANVASAMPIAPLAVKAIAPSGIETVQWRRHGGWHGGWHGGGLGWGIGAGLIGGAIIAGALTSPYYGYYGPGPYSSYGYYPGPAYVVPGQGGAVAYCMQRYRSYDPRSGTFLGYDGYRHPCP